MGSSRGESFSCHFVVYRVTPCLHWPFRSLLCHFHNLPFLPVHIPFVSEMSKNNNKRINIFCIFCPLLLPTSVFILKAYYAVFRFCQAATPTVAAEYLYLTLTVVNTTRQSRLYIRLYVFLHSRPEPLPPVAPPPVAPPPVAPPPCIPVHVQ